MTEHLGNRDVSEAKDIRNHLAQPPEFADEGDQLIQPKCHEPELEAKFPDSQSSALSTIPSLLMVINL